MSRRLLKKTFNKKEDESSTQWVDGSCHCVVLWTTEKIITSESGVHCVYKTILMISVFFHNFLYSRASLQFNHCLPVGVGE